MESSSPTDLTDAKQPSDTRSTLAKALAPEDIGLGDFVAVLHEVLEVLSLYWCRDSMLLPADEMVRVPYIPAGNGLPLKVKSVCLPFVLTRLPNGDCRTLDVRQCQLARLDRTYAVASWKAFKKK